MEVVKVRLYDLANHNEKVQGVSRKREPEPEIKDCSKTVVLI